MKVPSQCLQVEHTNTKSNAVYKKRELQLNEFTRKTTMSDNFELGGEDEMEPTSSVTFSTYVKSGTRIAEQASICVYKAYTLFIYFFK